MNQLDRLGYNRLHKAVIDKNYVLVEALAEAGADMNARSGIKHAGKTALHFAARANDGEMIKLLETLGAKPDTRDYKARTVAGYSRTNRTQ